MSSPTHAVAAEGPARIRLRSNRDSTTFMVAKVSSCPGSGLKVRLGEDADPMIIVTVAEWRLGPWYRDLRLPVNSYWHVSRCHGSCIPNNLNQLSTTSVSKLNLFQAELES